MTREEAVARIKDHIEIHRYHERDAVKIFEALDMAIKAMERPDPCEDAVSRKAVEEMLKNGFPARGIWEIEGDVVKQTVCETLADALMDLGKLPSVTPKRKE